MPWERNRRDVISLVLAVTGVILLPGAVINLSPGSESISSCEGRPIGTPQDVNLQPYDSQGSASFSSSSSSSGISYQLTYPYYEWAGYNARLPNYCSFQIDFDARELGLDASQGATGWGYGVGLCSSLNSGVPAGLSLQDNFEVGLDKLSVFNQVLLPSPDATYGKPLNIGAPIDKKWHHWTFRFSGNYWTVVYGNYTLIRHEAVSGASPLPDSCINSDLLFRVWGGTAEFRNIQIS